MADMEVQNLNELLQIRRDKLKELQEAGRDPFVITKYDVTHHSADVKDSYDEMEGKEVSIAGRLMSKRVMGKASFCNIQDLKGGIQCYVARDAVGEESYKDFKKMDIGDIVGLKGTVFKTKTDEDGRDFHPCLRTDPAVQEPADPAGEVSRADQYRPAVPSALC